MSSNQNAKVLELDDKHLKGNMNALLPEKTELENPMAGVWGIDLFFGPYPATDEEIFFIVFTSLITPTHVKKYFKLSELYSDKKHVLRTLRNVGIFQEHRYDYVVAYIEERLINKDYTVIENDLTLEIDGLDKSPKCMEDYKALFAYVLDNSDVFPQSKDEYKNGVSEGLFNDNILIVERKIIEDILGSNDKNATDDFIRFLKRVDVLLSGNHKKLTDRMTLSGVRKNVYRIAYDQGLMNEMG